MQSNDKSLKQNHGERLLTNMKMNGLTGGDFVLHVFKTIFASKSARPRKEPYRVGCPQLEGLRLKAQPFLIETTC